MCHQAEPWGLAGGIDQKRGRQCGPGWCLVSKSRWISAHSMEPQGGSVREASTGPLGFL